MLDRKFQNWLARLIRLINYQYNKYNHNTIIYNILYCFLIKNKIADNTDALIW